MRMLFHVSVCNGSRNEKVEAVADMQPPQTPRADYPSADVIRHAEREKHFPFAHGGHGNERYFVVV